MKKINLSLLFLLLSATTFAQTEESTAPVIAEPSLGLNTTELIIIALLLFAVVLLIVSIILFNAFKVMLRERANPTPYQKFVGEEPLDYEEYIKQQKSKPNIWTKLLSLKPLEEEKSLEIPHSYDGIKELNNPIPAWFNFLFYGTLIFAAGYLYYYHIGDGPGQDEEYATEVVDAEIAKKKFLAKSGTSIDENNVKIDSSEIVNGKGIFDANCIACHGEKGEGLVGPNLTDEFWLHGGSISDVFKVVKYGVPEKGMVSWEKNLSSKNISEVTNYIMSLKGTNPPNAKAPQGPKYEETSVSVQDTVKNESKATK
jgi:cytochrome c oxidase cbb3-type subunit 3